MKKKYIILSILILLLFASPGFQSMGFGQVSDTTVTADDIYKADEIPDPDSLNFKGNQLINDVDQANKILNESITIGMLDSLTSIPYFQDYYFNTDTALLNVYNFPMGLVPVYSDSVYRARSEKLDEETPLITLDQRGDDTETKHRQRDKEQDFQAACLQGSTGFFGLLFWWLICVSMQKCRLSYSFSANICS